MRFLWALIIVVAQATVITPSLHAQTASPPLITLAQHSENRARLLLLVQACVADALRCRPEDVGPDESIRIDSIETQVHYDWLRQTLKGMAVTGADRASLSKPAVTYLQQSDVAPNSSVETRTARRDMDSILAQSEFRQSDDQSWLSRIMTVAGIWLQRKLSSIGGSETSWAWVRTVLEWFFFGIPVVLLLIWAYRRMKEERLLPSRDYGSGFARSTKAVDWLSLANQYAAREEWREAIHSIYWETIADFERRRIWSASSTRTPREYLRLLQYGSAREKFLREQTRLLESTWYGYREATSHDYARAQELCRALVAE